MKPYPHCSKPTSSLMSFNEAMFQYRIKAVLSGKRYSNDHDLAIVEEGSETWDILRKAYGLPHGIIPLNYPEDDPKYFFNKEDFPSAAVFIDKETGFEIAVSIPRI